MKKFFCLLWLAGLALAGLPLRIYAQSGPEGLWQIFRDGLLSTNVSAVLPAEDGALWFGTDRGASRYDGEWTSLSSQNGLPEGRVRSLAQTKDGALWFGMESGGLARRAPDGACCRVWTTADGLPSNDVSALLPDPGGKAGLWVGTAQGLVYLDGDRPAAVPAVPAVRIWALTGNADGEVWPATEGQGIWHFDPSGGWQAVDNSALLVGPLYSLLEDSDGKMWVGTENGLIYSQHGVWQRFPLTADDTGLRVFAIRRDAQQGLWIGTEQGLFFVAGDRYVADGQGPGVHTPDTQLTPATMHFRSQDGLANDHVRAMAFDRDGALWLGTIGGASRYAGAVWQRIQEPRLAGQRVNALLTDSSGRTWAGTEGHGLFMWDGNLWRRFMAQDGLNDDRIVALFEDNHGRVWAGTGTGVGFWDTAGGWHMLEPADGLPGIPVWSISQDPAGRMWFGTNNGLVRWSQASGFEKVTELDGYRINALRQTMDGALWAGTDQNGVYRLANGAWQRMPLEENVALPGGGPKFKSVAAHGIVEQSDGTLWIGTYDDGLWHYLPAHDTAKAEWRQVDVPLASPRLLALMWGDDSLWVGTRGGLTRFDEQSTQSYAGSVLPSPEVSALAPGVAGSFWLGTLGGLVHYWPEKTPPWVRIDSVNLTEPHDATVQLKAGEALSVRLAGGSAGLPAENLKYLTQLQGVDLSPEVRTDRLVSYGVPPLQPGTYRLRAWTRDEAFNYSSPAEVVLRIVEPERTVVLPGGFAMPAVLFYPGLILGLLAVGGLVTAGNVIWHARRVEEQRAAAQATRRQEALARHFNPYVSGEPVRDPDMFFGRHALLRKILNALHQNSIMIHGERRIGKTSLLFRLSEELRAAEDPEWVFIPVLIDLEGTPQEHFFHFLMDNICGVLRVYLPRQPRLGFQTIAPSVYTDRDFMADLRFLLDALKPVAAPRNVRVILLLDEMDVINGYDTITQQQLRRIFMSALAQNLGAVVAGVQISKTWDKTESPWYNLFNELVLDPFPIDEARRLLTEPVRGVYEWDSDALEFVVAHAAGRPYRLQQYALAAVNHMLAEGRQCITMADVAAADQAIERVRAEK